MILKYDDWNNILVNGFVKLGCETKQASIISDNLVLTEAAGIASHGLTMAIAHVNKIRKNDYNLIDNPTIELQTQSLTKVNSKGTIGLYSAKVCMDIAIKNAIKYGMHTVFANNANTLGAAFVYAYQAAKEGLIGIVMSNSPSQMAPIGGKEKLFGTNPFAYAIPAKKEKPIIFDMATSVVAKSKILVAKNKGEDIPIGWATDENGCQTTNAEKALNGLVLPMSGAKGYGLSMMIDILSGVISNSYYLDRVNRFYNTEGNCMNVGHSFVCINPKILFTGDFYEEIDAYIKRIKKSTPINGQKIRIPGENKLNHIDLAQKNGIEIDDTLAEDIHNCFL